MSYRNLITGLCVLALMMCSYTSIIADEFDYFYTDSSSPPKEARSATNSSSKASDYFNPDKIRLTKTSGPRQSTNISKKEVAEEDTPQPTQKTKRTFSKMKNNAVDKEAIVEEDPLDLPSIDENPKVVVPPLAPLPEPKIDVPNAEPVKKTNKPKTSVSKNKKKTVPQEVIAEAYPFDPPQQEKKVEAVKMPVAEPKLDEPSTKSTDSAPFSETKAEINVVPQEEVTMVDSPADTQVFYTDFSSKKRDASQESIQKEVKPEVIPEAQDWPEQPQKLMSAPVSTESFEVYTSDQVESKTEPIQNLPVVRNSETYAAAYDDDYDHGYEEQPSYGYSKALIAGGAIVLAGGIAGAVTSNDKHSSHSSRSESSVSQKVTTDRVYPVGTTSYSNDAYSSGDSEGSAPAYSSASKKSSSQSAASQYSSSDEYGHGYYSGFSQISEQVSASLSEASQYSSSDEYSYDYYSGSSSVSAPAEKPSSKESVKNQSSSQKSADHQLSFTVTMNGQPHETGNVHIYVEGPDGVIHYGDPLQIDLASGTTHSSFIAIPRSHKGAYKIVVLAKSLVRELTMNVVATSSDGEVIDAGTQTLTPSSRPQGTVEGSINFTH